jgi:hypothetical protein
MTSIVHIFRKDVRHLTPFILITLALQAALAIATVRIVGVFDPTQHLQAMLFLCETLIPFAWMFLLALAVLQDPPVGDNSFWLTRPYSWPHLLMAKLLFAVAFLNLPLFLSDCLILQSLGLPLDMSHLLLRQLPLWALVIVPAFAIAAISRNVSQFTLLLVALILVLILSGFLQARLNLHISDVLVVLSLPLAALPVVVIQFAKRATFTRFLLAAIVAVLLPAAFFTAHLTQDGAFFCKTARLSLQPSLGAGSFSNRTR